MKNLLAKQKEEFLVDLKLVCEKHGISFTTAKRILSQNAFFPRKQKICITKVAKRKGINVPQKRQALEKLLEEVNKINGTNYTLIS